MDMKKPMGTPAFKQTGNLSPMGQSPKVPGAPAFKGTSGTTAVNPKSPFSKGK